MVTIARSKTLAAARAEAKAACEAPECVVSEAPKDEAPKSEPAAKVEAVVPAPVVVEAKAQECAETRVSVCITNLKSRGEIKLSWN